MSDNQRMSEIVASHVPFLRRYARALTGSQKAGDQYARATLEAVLADRTILTTGGHTRRVALYRAFHSVWSTSGKLITQGEEDPLRLKAQQNMAHLEANSREALLLHTVEQFSLQDVAQILGRSADEAQQLVNNARDAVKEQIKGRVMIIEDEAIIAADLESIVESMGHAVAGPAQTAGEAVNLGKDVRPDLILADIQLADNSSGIDAVQTLLELAPETPVVFITAFPERLLTGERPEPAFLITKPFQPAEVISAISQAMFFASTETLHAQRAV